MKNENTISFKSGALFNIANKLETDTTWQLLSQDVGTAGGRTISARNNDERREILIRDLGSIFFYMFNMPLINMALNKIEQDGRSTRTDSMNAAYLKDVIVAQMKDHLKTNKISPENLEKLLLGAGNVLDNDNFRNLLNETFKDNAMNLDEIITKIPEFCEKLGVEDVGNYKLLAERMSELQPKLEGKALITKDQVVKLFNGGLLNDPEFLKNVYSLNYGVENNLPNFLNPFKFIHNNSVEKFNDKSIERVDGDLRYFATQIIEKAKKSGYEITEEILEKAVKKNFRFNLLNWGTGFGVSALFLSTLIPKIQYWITQKRTGSNEFPGTKEFRQE